MVKKAKIDSVASLTEKLTQAKSVILTQYCGLTVEEITDLRKKCRAQNVEFKVIKNRLFKLALQDSKYQAIDETLKGPIGVAFSYKDPVSGAKIISEYAKTNEKLAIKCGLMDKVYINEKMVQTLSKLPSKEVLYASIAGGINGTARGLAVSINAVIQKVALAVSEVAKQKTA